VCAAPLHLLLIITFDPASATFMSVVKKSFLVACSSFA
jgi:hypothetical protein